MRFSIGRALRAAIAGLTLVLGLVAALAVANLYDTRQNYEDELARTYALETQAARVLAAGVIEEAALRGAVGASERSSAAAGFEAEAARALALAPADPASDRLVRRRIELEREARRAPTRAAFDVTLADARRVTAQLAARQAVRRDDARAEAGRDTRRAVIVAALAGGLALAGALALAVALVGILRRPLDELVAATRDLASGDRSRRVEPGGPEELHDLGMAFNAMAGDLEGADAALRAQRERLATTLESLSDAVVVCDADRRVVLVNPSAEDLLPGLVPGTIAGVPLPTLRQALTSEVEIEHQGRTLSIVAAELADGAGTVWTARDDSERARLDRLRSEFVATASHELRSPLTSVRGFVELLAGSDGLPERERGWAARALRGAGRLGDLVEDLLEVAALEAGGIALRRRPTDLAGVVTEVVETLEERVRDKGQTIAVHVDPETPVAFIDGARLRQIVTNLITNAHLYGGDGGRIDVRLRPAGETVELVVADNGPGIPADELDHVFERFYRGAGELVASGTGLGLAIVRSLVEAHGGTIGVSSQLGEGTEFSIRVPAAPRIDDQVSKTVPLEHARVLIVEDEEDAAELISAQLRSRGARTLIAESGRRAIELLRDEQFDAVTLDVMLPDLDGLDVLAAIRADHALAGTPVVFISAFPRATPIGEIVVTKPIDPDDLVDALGAVMRRGRSKLLVAASRRLRATLEPRLRADGFDYDWAEDAAGAKALAAERPFEVALIDPALGDEALVRPRGRRRPRAVLLLDERRGGKGG